MDNGFARIWGLFIASKWFPSVACSAADMPGFTASDVEEPMFHLQMIRKGYGKLRLLNFKRLFLQITN